MGGWCGDVTKCFWATITSAHLKCGDQGSPQKEVGGLMTGGVTVGLRGAFKPQDNPVPKAKTPAITGGFHVQ